MSQDNPFTPPGPTPTGGPEPRSVDAGRGIEWLKQGWQLFLRNPGVWIAIAVIMLIVLFVLGLIPFLGQLLVMLALPVLLGGLLQGCRALSAGAELKIDHLFAGFRDQFGPLVTVGVFYMVGGLLIGAVAVAITGGAAFTGGMVGHMAGAGMAVGGFGLAMLLIMVLGACLAMAFWFAPALVVFGGEAPMEAMKRSFSACVRNIGTFIVLAVILMVAGFIAMLPMGLGMLLLMPVVVGAAYASYLDVFGNGALVG